MKKILLLFFILLLIVILGGVIFLATLDLDKYRPQIIGRLESALGIPVQLEKISFTWHEGLALSLQGLALQDPASEQPLLGLRSAKVLLDFAPLLNRKIQMTTLYLERPVVNLVRRPDGKIQGFQTARKTKKQPAAPAALAFFVGKVRIDSAEIFFRDEGPAAPVEITLHDIDVQLRDVALNEPIDFDIKAGVLSGHQNVHITGILRVSPQGQGLSNVHGETDLSALDLKELSKLVPALLPQSGSQLSGQLTMDVGRLMLSPDGLRHIVAEMHLIEGGFRAETLEAKNIGADLFAKSGTLEIKNLSADYAGGKISGNGKVNLKAPVPLVSLQTKVQKLSLENAMEGQDPAAPQLKGLLSASFQGTFSAASSPRTLAGEGKLQLEDGRIENLNVLREVFRKFSLIPGLVDTLNKRLPPDYQDRLKAPHTVFETVQIPFSVQQGIVLFNRLDLRSDSFALQGAGRLGLEKQLLEGQASLFIDPDLSLALVESVRELQALTDRQGMMQIPLNFQGRLPRVSVIPDLQYIASRLAVVKTQDILSGLWKQPEPSPTPQMPGPSPVSPDTQNSPSTPTRSKPPKASAILGQLLESVLAPQESETTQTP